MHQELLNDIREKGYIVFMYQEGKNTKDVQNRPAVVGFLPMSYANALHRYMQIHTNYMILMTVPSKLDYTYALGYDKKNNKITGYFTYGSQYETERFNSEQRGSTNERTIPVACIDPTWGGNTKSLLQAVSSALDNLH